MIWWNRPQSPMGASLEIFSIHRRHIFLPVCVCACACVRYKKKLTVTRKIAFMRSNYPMSIDVCLAWVLRFFFFFLLRSYTKIHQLMHIQILRPPRHCCCCWCDLTHPQCFAYILYITEVIKINFWQPPNFLSYMPFLSFSVFFSRLRLFIFYPYFYNIAYWFDGASLARFSLSFWCLHLSSSLSNIFQRRRKKNISITYSVTFNFPIVNLDLYLSVQFLRRLLPN